jgi:putative flippase GtrA
VNDGVSNPVRFAKYSAVGLLGLTVKFGVLIGLCDILQMGYLAATALAVEAVVLHNFFWHLRWTWGERSRGLSPKEVLARLWRFHLGNAAVAMAVNLGAMELLVGLAGLHYVAANLAATAGAGLANFVISNSLVFVPLQKPSVRLGTSFALAARLRP